MSQTPPTDPKPRIFPSVIPDIADWPIYRLSQDRKRFVPEIDDFTLKKLLAEHPKLSELIAETIYAERIRIKEEPWKIDPPKEAQFWSKLRSRLAASQGEPKEKAREAQIEILKKIIHRYSTEIVGTFKIGTFRFARVFLTFFFSRLLNAAAAPNLYRYFTKNHKLYDHLSVRGELEHIRALMSQGTVIVVPTHYSNLDSILVGYAMDEILGLPSFNYGAGLNLYNSGLPAYFMNRLGAYRVDRRKKNAVYLETLKAMSKLAIERGTNSLFFPGGTRSRSGVIETRLKLGLLGTAVEAQRSLYERGLDNKVFIVPLVLGYHFVLEAPFLIHQHLKASGKERYLEGRDGTLSVRSNLKFLWQIFSKKSEILLSFGKPMDVMGNFVDMQGVSHDSRGNEIAVSDYFKDANGTISEDSQRETQYTKMLAERIVDRFYKENIVLSSQVMAFTAFNMLRNHHEKMDLYNVLRLPPDNFVFPIEVFTAAVEAMKTALFELESKGRLKLSEEIYLPTDELIKDGVKHLGVFHVKKPLTFNRKGDLESDDFYTLFYYHNHLENYGLTKRVNWDLYKMEMAD
jgi:glycerol-3-phosphate O-acyltransferase